MKNILSEKWIIKNRDLKIPKFYSIEYENFSKFYQTQINEIYLSEKWIIKKSRFENSIFL